MTNPFRDLSIGRKLTWMIMLTSSFVVLIACLAFLIYDRIETQNRMVRNVESLARMVGNTPALHSGGQLQAEQVLAMFRTEKQVIAAAIYRPDGRVLARYDRDGMNFDPPDPEQIGTVFEADYLDLVHRIDWGEKPTRTVFIRMGLDALYAHETRYGIFAVVFLIFCSLIAFLISSTLQVFISGPILRLANLARRVSTDKDYSLQAHRDTSDEVGVLIDAFNEMLSEVHQRDVALKEANDALESRVAERTFDLQTANQKLEQEVGDRERAEEALVKSREQLRQSQKMEAIGQLAGGVAHDFNNQLAIIQGYIDMAMSDLPRKSPTRGRLLQVSKAVHRSMGLTHQLLMFSSNQPVEMRPIDLNQHLEELQTMMERLIGEDIESHLDLSDDLWTASADPSNVDQVMTNLFVNARDAMPEGGTITVQTQMIDIDQDYCRRVGEARPGHFIQLSVSDTGIGMSDEVRAHLFEPFYTTKEPGKGTGLGLSVVYGIVQSNGGWITVESRLGGGTRFDIYLTPAAEEPDSGEGHLPTVILDQFEGNGERILVVEDESALGEMTRQLLADRGYLVQLCHTADDARRSFREAPFDLVLSDVVLPDGRGPDLVDEFINQQPDLAAVLITGYTDERSDRERVREAGLLLLQKPIPMSVLLEQVHNALTRQGETS